MNGHMYVKTIATSYFVKLNTRPKNDSKVIYLSVVYRAVYMTDRFGVIRPISVRTVEVVASDLEYEVKFGRKLV